MSLGGINNTWLADWWSKIHFGNMNDFPLVPCLSMLLLLRYRKTSLFNVRVIWLLAALACLAVTPACHDQSEEGALHSSSPAVIADKSLDELMAGLRSNGLPEEGMTAASKLVGRGKEAYPLIVGELGEVIKLSNVLMSSRKRYASVQSALAGLYEKGVFERKDLGLVLDAMQRTLLISDTFGYTTIVQKELKETPWTEEEILAMTEKEFAAKLQDWRRKLSI